MTGVSLNFSAGLVFLMGLMWPGLTAQPASNLEILHRILVNSIIAGIDSVRSGEQGVSVEVSGPDDMAPWVQRMVRTNVMQKDIVYYDKTFPDMMDHLTVVVEELDARIVYRSKHRNLLLRTTDYQREVYSVLSFYIKNKDESIRYSYSKSVDEADIVSRKDIEQIENSFYSFSRGQFVESAVSKKIVEPLLIAVTTLGVIYLFFSLRSSS